MLTAQELLVIFNRSFCELADIICNEKYLEVKDGLQEFFDDLMIKKSASDLDLAAQLAIGNHLQSIHEVLNWIINLYETDASSVAEQTDGNYYYVYPIIDSVLGASNYLRRILAEEAQIASQLEHIDQAMLGIFINS